MGARKARWGIHLRIVLGVCTQVAQIDRPLARGRLEPDRHTDADPSDGRHQGPRWITDGLTSKRSWPSGGARDTES
jgi:hypothetical protein